MSDPLSVPEKVLLRMLDSLVRFESMIEAAADHFELDEKRLEDLCKNQVKQLMIYDVALQECKAIQDSIETQRDVIKSLHWRRLNETNKKTLTTRDIEAYIQGEPSWVSAHELVLQAAETRKKLEAIVEALKQLGWTLTNIVKLRVHQLEDSVI